MKYFSPCNYQSDIAAKPELHSTIVSTYLGKKLTQEFADFYALCVNLINRPQFQAVNNPTFQKLDFSLKPSFKKQLNYYLRTQVKSRGLKEAHDASDRLFEAFTPIYSILQDNEQLFSAALYWRRVSEFIDKWERRNNFEVHKGTIFSFWSLAELLAGDSDVGFMLMRNGLKEDERYHNSLGLTTKLTSPGADFIKLDIKTKNSFFRNIVKKLRKPLAKRISIYNSTFNFNFNLKVLQRKFSATSSLEEASLYFNVTHLRITRVKRMFKLNLGNTQTSRHILLASLFDISKIAEVVSRTSSAAQNNRHNFTIRTFLIHLNKHNNWGLDIKLLADEIDRKFKGTSQEVEDIAKDLLIRKMPLASNQNFPTVVYDCLLLYGLRNYGAHAIDKIPDIFTEEYVNIIQMSYNALFFVVENYQVI